MTLQLTHVLEITCQHQPEVICATFGDESSLTYRQALRSLVEHTAWLEQTIWSGRNDVAIAYLANNSIDLILSVLVSSTVEVPCLLVNTRWSASEIATAVSSPNPSAVTFLLYGAEFRERIPDIKKYMNHALVALPIPTFALQHMQSSNAIQRPRKHQPPLVEPLAFYSQYSPKDAVIVFTSGTSQGRPKGVRLSHQAIAIQCWAKCQLPCAYSHNTKMLASTVPFFHIGGLSSLLAAWMAGGQIVLPRQEVGFDPESVWKFIAPSMKDPTVARANTLVVVPAMLFMMQQHKTNPNPNHAVRLILVGGQSITESQKSFLRAAFPVARVVQTYACTEAASSLTFHSVNFDPARTNLQQQLSGDCVGSPPEHIDICLVDKDLWIEKNEISVITSPFSMGIIATRGPYVMNGYWARGLEAENNRSPDQYFVTNDLAYWDKNGQLYFAGRVNDSIRTGGETVLSSEVERVLQLHPLIDECAVFPVPDPKFGEAVACAIVPSQGGLTLQQIREWCQEKGLSNYKHPRHMVMMQQLPKNSSGKTLKYLLIEQFSSKPRSKL
ncbi:acyl-activating enzyme 14 [Fistulifera solaris]|uniref:Acyl-activating enzyme 14 n=1 Tax=Fistulifera solaris TaxID=1519565 RepID=A0A1Z5JB52_FISSO|nr:acyl-activating enzyme 14 [Fistulifera solaris]|eukprot:GAX11122.1 acyl-activating enzyme 14 [Fistulifera solaris]